MMLCFYLYVISFLCIIFFLYLFLLKLFFYFLYIILNFDVMFFLLIFVVGFIFLFIINMKFDELSILIVCKIWELLREELVFGCWVMLDKNFKFFCSEMKLLKLCWVVLCFEFEYNMMLLYVNVRYFWEYSVLKFVKLLCEIMIFNFFVRFLFLVIFVVLIFWFKILFILMWSFLLFILMVRYFFLL